MDEQRMNAYVQLIQRLLECANGEEAQILSDNFELIDSGLLKIMIQTAQYCAKMGNQNYRDFLTNLALEIGEWLGSDQQPKAIRKQTADLLLECGIWQYDISRFLQSIQCWQQSLIIYQAIHDRQGEGTALGNLGTAYRFLREYKQAITFYEKSLVIFQEIKHRQWEATCLKDLGDTYDSQGQYERAIAFYKEHLAISREINDRQGEATALRDIGNAYLYLGHFEQTITFHEQSLVICQEIKHYQGEAYSLIGLGDAYYSLGEYQRAIDFHRQSLVISKEINHRDGEALSLTSLGLSYLYLGQFEQALALYENSLAISQEIKNSSLEANSLIGLGSVYFREGKYDQALNLYQQSLVVCQEIKHHQGEATCLRNLGNACFSMKEYEQALNFYEKSLVICQQIKYRQGEGSVLGNLGLVYRFLGQFDKVIAFHQQSLAISREIKYRQGEATALNNIGDIYQELQLPEKAIEKFEDSLKIATPETMPPECFRAGRNLGNSYFTQGDWQLALEGYEPAMQAVEQLRKGFTTDENRQKIIKAAMSVYANAVQCYINLKQYDKAVETADRSRSRHLADLFASKDLYPQGEIPPEVAEYYRLQEQSNRLGFSDNDGTRAFAATRQATPNSDATLKLIENLEAQKQQAWLKIRSKDPVLAGQLQADPLSFQQMQALIPDTETAILNFYTTDKHTHVFILRQNQPPQLHTCEGQGYETLQNWIINNWLNPYLENRNIWSSQMRDFLPEIAQRLQLNQLIAEHLTGIKELIIIPHLFLHQIPFAALPLNGIPIPQSNTAYDKTRVKAVKKPDPAAVAAAKTPSQQPEYLSDKFRLRIVPSCQILNYCHQRGTQKPATMGIVENATGDLVFTGYECETLAKTHKVPKNRRLKYQEATISNYQNLLHQVNVLHSSHHAASNLNNSLESKLLLSDGDINLGRLFTWRFLQLAEVFLSCCETNLTLTPITDDPLSIASGFLCAGARHVVSTLWAVDDLATALFCILYYEEKRNKSRSEAIRQAQFKLRNLTGDELSAKYSKQLEDYLTQQQLGENQAEIMYNVRRRLNFLRLETLPFVSPHYWSGFVSQGLA